MKNILFVLTFIFLFLPCFSQSSNSTYRTVQNSLYWKNRKPHDGYWQQDVHYIIKARINDNTNILDGNLELIYYNNSPDALPFVYFHLYQNAFLPGSYYAQKSAQNGFELQYGSYQKNGLGTEVEELTINGLKHEFITDNTLMKVFLQTPIESGDSCVFKIKFKTYFNEDAGWGRMRLYKRWGFKHFNGAHWYPRISVYDARFGWTADQHLVHEFYGDFGTFDVELDFPDNYILEATGTLTNESLMFPPALRQKIALENFKDKPFNSAPDIIIPYDSTKRKIWKYHADNVHDFAFVASPTYRIGVVMYKGIKCVAIAHEPHASKWQTAPQLTADIIRIFSEKIGTYHYPKMVVADAFSGMEYPMLTMNSGTAPDYAYIFSHEMGHNWFFGMIGSNETYRAFLDEGFTQYLTVFALEELQKKYAVESPPSSKYLKNYKKERTLRDRYAYLRYIRHAVSTDGVQLNTHSDMFDTQSPYGEEYRQSYYKGATMLFNLEYVLGEDLFDKAMKEYFNQWKFCHPYEEDLRASFIKHTQLDLNWFFDQFIGTNKFIDYKVKSAKKFHNDSTYIIHFIRKGSMQMPLDFTVVDKKDSMHHFYIPNTDFVKKTPAVVLPKWYGWLGYNKDYYAKVTSPFGIKNVIIDPTKRLADIYAPDNALKKNIDISFDNLIIQTEDIHNYEMFFRPDIFWNGYEGIKAGANLNGHYMGYYHQFDLYAWYNTGLLNLSNLKIPPLSYHFSYNTPVTRYHKKIRIFLHSLYTENIFKNAIQLRYKINSNGDYFYNEVKSFFLSSDYGNYLNYSKEWESVGLANAHNSISMGYRHFYANRKRNGFMGVNTHSSFILSPYDYTKLNFEHVNNEILNVLKFRTRFMLQYATGKHIPSESMLYLSGASPEELTDNKFTRSIGYVPEEWSSFGPNTQHFHAGGGLNIRGYSGYLVAQKDKNGNIVPVYKGHSGVSVNSELEFDGMFDLKPIFLKDIFKLNTYLFADAGLISVNNLSDKLFLSDLRASAGLGLALTVKKWGVLNKLNPFTLRFDVPLFLNRPPAVEDNFFSYRWLIAINRAF